MIGKTTYRHPDAALIDMLLAVTTEVGANEFVSYAAFGQFDQSVGGGYYWSLTIGRTLGNTVDSRARPNGTEERRRMIGKCLEAVQAWRDREAAKNAPQKEDGDADDPA